MRPRRIALIVLGAALLASPAAGVPQQYTPSGVPVGPEYIVAAIERILPGNWQITEQREGKAPSRWTGAADALYLKLEDTSVNIHHPDGYTSHPYIKLYFCPRDWSGTMEEIDYYGEVTPSLLLGKNHEYKVFYQTRGALTWEDPWAALATTFDLTPSKVDRDLKNQVDAQVRVRLAQRLKTVRHDLPEDILDRVVGLEREGSLLYVEYVANVSTPPPAPGAPPLETSIRNLIERETHLLAAEIFRLFPEVTAVYVRRVCDNRMFDELVDRAVPAGGGPGEGSSAPNAPRAADPVTAGGAY